MILTANHVTARSPSRQASLTPSSGSIQKQLQNLLEALLRREVAVHPGIWTTPVESNFVEGVYTSDDGEVRAVCHCELSLAAHSSAALSLIPVGVAGAAVGSGKLDEELLENFQEVLNVCSRLFNDNSTKHVRLANVAFGRGAVFALKNQEGVRDFKFDVTVSGYGGGRLELRALRDDTANAL